MFRLPPPKCKHQRSLARIPAAARPVWLCANARKYTKYFLCFALRHPPLSPAVLRTALHWYLHSLWTPLSPQRTRGCSPLVTPKRRSSGKNRAVCPAAQTLFRFFPSSDFECCARVWQNRQLLLSPASSTPHSKNSPRRVRGEFYAAGAAYFRYLCTARATMPPRMPETKNSATPCTPTSSTTNINGLAAPLLATRLCT